MNWHTIEFSDGSIEAGYIPLECLKYQYNALQLPNLEGKTIIDIGAAEGFYSLEFAKAGAKVLAVNLETVHYNSCVENINRSKLPNISAMLLSIYDLQLIDRKFDIVCMMGLIYHLRHPLLGIDIGVAKAKELIVIESYYIASNDPIATFYQYDQLNNDHTNWWGPSIVCIEQMLQSAGCQSTKLIQDNIENHRCIVHGYK